MNFGYPGEMIFICFLALILFGPKKMPEIGRQVARLLNEFRRASNEFRSQIEAEVNSLDVNGKDGGRHSGPQILPSLQAPLGSLASRIFNPPSAERPEVVEHAVPENTAVIEAEVTPPSTPRAEPERVEPEKVAPDA